ESPEKKTGIEFCDLLIALTNSMRSPLCLPEHFIAVDWSGYPSQEYHILRASLICDGRSIPLLSRLVSSAKQNNLLIQKEFLDELHRRVNPKAKVILITDAGFRVHGFGT
ncbi:hypothetical protein EJT82_05315, partial [Salmonella enterica]|nr:hypothetical protein [Salmonella enterica]EAW1192740.1 hypothetical protein [Salmonella enterica subsp. enterica]ECC3879395.1 hypothetical protein [Salmonella enterica subsp. diarizonae]ECT9715087.1 hypothetical protein [Salmonella enterica subsp. diarizonae str. CFSAN000553]EAM3004448.1 hypothetical protein [Salmonella enterica]